MLSNNDNYLSDCAEGITKGVISLGSDAIKSIVRRFLDRKLVFINNSETIDLVKEQLKTGEWSLCQPYLKNKDLKILVQMGLALRRLESKPEQLQSLRDKILDKYLSRGLHIAQLVQNNILTEFIGSVASKVGSGSEIVEKVENILFNVDKFVVFIKTSDNLKKKCDEILIKLRANEPHSMILCSSRTAREVCLQVKKIIEKETTNYIIETKEEKQRLLVFLFRKEINFVIG